MRILLAYDGSPSADRAAALVASLHRPAGSAITVATVAIRERDEARMNAAGDAVIGLLRDAGWDADGSALSGRPADALVDAARDLGADLIVVGDRGHSALARLVLGSTAAAVADHAPCAVLVARDSTTERIVLADDGSESARLAGEFLTRSGLFDEALVTVVTVVDAERPVISGVNPERGMSDAIAAVVNAERADFWLQGEETAIRLGVPTRAVRLRGQPASELVRYVEATETSLVVLGTRADTGITRVLLGSVARDVLLHATSSVLLIRPPEAAEPARREPGE